MHQLLMSQTDDIWRPSCNLMTCKSIVAALSVVMTFAADLRRPASAYSSGKNLRPHDNIYVKLIFLLLLSAMLYASIIIAFCV